MEGTFINGSATFLRYPNQFCTNASFGTSRSMFNSFSLIEWNLYTRTSIDLLRYLHANVFSSCIKVFHSLNRNMEIDFKIKFYYLISEYVYLNVFLQNYFVCFRYAPVMLPSIRSILVRYSYFYCCFLIYDTQRYIYLFEPSLIYFFI